MWWSRDAEVVARVKESFFGEGFRKKVGMFVGGLDVKELRGFGGNLDEDHH